MAANALGATTVIMDRFDPEEFLALVERYRVTVVQVVPTMFVRLLKLPAEVRNRYDVSSLRSVIHAAAPCPVPVKEQMIEWFGPVIHEYYAGTEANGFVYCNSQDWLAHPGTVGRLLVGTIHVCDDELNEVPVGETGKMLVRGGPTSSSTTTTRKRRQSWCAGPRTPMADWSERNGAVASRAPGSTSVNTSRSDAHAVSANSATVRTSATRNANGSNNASSVAKSGTFAHRSPRHAQGLVARLRGRDEGVGEGSRDLGQPRGRIAHERGGRTVGQREHGVIPGVGDPRAVVRGQLGRRPLVGVDEGFGHRHVEVLTAVRVLALVQGGEDAADREQAGGDVAVDVGALLGRRVAQARVELHPSDLGLHHRGVARVAATTSCRGPSR